MLTFYDSDGYAIGHGAEMGNPDPLKPGSTVEYYWTVEYADYKDKYAFVSIDYCGVKGGPTDVANHTRSILYFHYAFDRSGKQIDYNTLIQ